MKKKNNIARDIINATKYWNGGAGLIIPRAMKPILDSMGLKDGFTYTKNAILTKNNVLTKNRYG